ncbi:hypothetical protein BJV82DRAFT_710778 [Fennellomyces sp. T-0311]|nr:hypothetical protein BJV82DRAFT_710778 [Fennellomyces sp. T-0311]
MSTEDSETSNIDDSPRKVLQDLFGIGGMTAGRIITLSNDMNLPDEKCAKTGQPVAAKRIRMHLEDQGFDVPSLSLIKEDLKRSHRQPQEDISGKTLEQSESRTYYVPDTVVNQTVHKPMLLKRIQPSGQSKAKRNVQEEDNVSMKRTSTTVIQRKYYGDEHQRNAAHSGAVVEEDDDVLRKLRVDPNTAHRKVNLSELEIAILRRIATEGPTNDSPSHFEASSSTGNNSRTGTSTPSSTSAASKIDSFPLTATARVENEDRFQKFHDKKKWMLKTGRYVEDIMYDYGATLPNEHPVHSFILYIDDPAWKSRFNEEEYDEVVMNNNFELPNVYDKVGEWFSALEKLAVDGLDDGEILDLLADTVQGFGSYDFRTQFDLHCVRSSLEQLRSYYKYDVIGKLMPIASEIDLISTFWSIFDCCFDNAEATAGRDRTCLASSLHINGDRSISGKDSIDKKKSVSHPDLLLLRSGFEFGCSEVGKSTDVIPTKKEIVETCLHSPKTMKDLLDRLASEADNDATVIRNLRIVCFHYIARKMKASFMDCPGGYVCRVQETEEYEIPLKVSSVVTSCTYVNACPPSKGMYYATKTNLDSLIHKKI